MAAQIGRRHDEPTLRTSDQPSAVVEALERRWRRRWVRALIVGLVVVLVVMTAVQKLWIDPQLTAVKYRVTLIGQSDGPVFEIDDEAGVVAVRNAQHGPERFVLVGERVHLPATVVDPSGDAEAWLSFPAEAVMEDPKVFSVQRILDSFDLGVKECVLPGVDADALVKSTLAQTFEPDADQQRYNLCGSAIGGGGFADGHSVRVQQERIRPSEVFRPAADVVTAVEDMGEKAADLTALAAESFRDNDRPEGGESSFVCFALRSGEPMQAGLDFYGYFIERGTYLDGIQNLAFRSADPVVEVRLEAGVVAGEWIASLPPEVLADPVLADVVTSYTECGLRSSD